jgi:hypothetical protein
VETSYRRSIIELAAVGDAMTAPTAAISVWQPRAASALRPGGAEAY